MEKLKDLVQDGFTIAVFSNQNGVEKGKQTTDSLIAKFKDIGKSLCEHQIPICFFASTHEDLNRKPNIGLWRTLCRTLSIDFDESLKDSFYVGDAAGRITGWSKGKKKDFSDSDRKFALNLKIPFFTPEEYFLGEQSAKFVLSGFDPFTFSPEESNLPVTSDVQEIVVFVGFPGSGKTFLFRDVFAPANYEHVNRDSLKSLGKCQKLAIEALKSGKSVVIDNTNPSRSSRAEWIKLSQQFHVPVRCIYFDISRDLAEHLNKIRFKLYPEIVKVPALAYNVYAKNFEMPQLSEGFTQIRQVKFSLRSKDPDFEKLFFSYS
jgi:bifunctional polynucleotide phosphatase/kinase